MEVLFDNKENNDFYLFNIIYLVSSEVDWNPPESKSHKIFLLLDDLIVMFAKRIVV
jgi:hypothetical protein